MSCAASVSGGGSRVRGEASWGPSVAWALGRRPSSHTTLTRGAFGARLRFSHLKTHLRGAGDGLDSRVAECCNSPLERLECEPAASVCHAFRQALLLPPHGCTVVGGCRYWLALLIALAINLTLFADATVDFSSSYGCGLGEACRNNPFFHWVTQSWSPYVPSCLCSVRCAALHGQQRHIIYTTLLHENVLPSPTTLRSVPSLPVPHYGVRVHVRVCVSFGSDSWSRECLAWCCPGKPPSPFAS